MKHYYIEDRSNKKKALTQKGFPSYANDSIQFNLHGDGMVIANIQVYDLETTSKKSQATKDLAVLIDLDDLRLAYEWLSGKVLSVNEVDEIMKKATSPEVA